MGRSTHQPAPGTNGRPAAVDPAQPPQPLVLELFGGLRVVVGGRDVAALLPGRQGRALVAYLVLHRDRPVSRAELVDALWPSSLPASPDAALGSLLAKVRRVLGPMMIGGRQALTLHLAAGSQIDARTVSEQIERAERCLADPAPDATAALDAAHAVLELLARPLLPDLDGEWIESWRRRFDELVPRALEIAARAGLALGDGHLPEAQRAADALVAREPFREAGYALLMRAQAGQGNHAEALRTFERVRVLIRDELGASPSPSLLALHARLLRDEAPVRPSTTPPRRGPSARAVSLQASIASAARGAIVGRAADLARLADVYADAAGGHRRLVLLCGEPGIGKTRLAAEFATRAYAAGAIVLHGRCDEEALLAQQPFVEALRHYVCACSAHELAGALQLASGELRRIVPEIAERVPNLPEPLAGDPEGARSRLFEAIGALLCEIAQTTPVVLVIDDLHWADTATLLLLKCIARDPRQARLMVLGTYRESELDVAHPLLAMLADLGSARLLERRAIARLDVGAVSELVGVLVGDVASPALSRAVFEGTDGNAFYVVELLRHLVESGAITDLAEPSGLGEPVTAVVVPESVRTVVGRRLARLGPQTGRVLAAASVLGRDFQLGVLQRLSGLGEDELLDALESALRAHLVDEVCGSAGRFTFAHAIVRETLYSGLTATRRALLHRRAGAALEQVHPEDDDRRLSQLAHHFAHAGSSGELKAIEYGARAAEDAIARLAYEQAAARYRQTVALIDAGNRPRLASQRCDLVIAQGEAERQAGDPAYRRTLLDAATLARELGDRERLARAALANNRGYLSSAWGIDRDRVSVLRAALESYDVADSPTRAALLALLALELAPDDDWRARDKLGDEALAMARRVGHPRTLALVLTQRSVAQWHPTRVRELQADLREAANLAERLDDPLLAGHAEYLGAHAAMEAGDLARADLSIERMSAIAARLGQPVLRWYDAVARAKRCAISGPADEAERLALAGLQLGTAAGQADAIGWYLDQLYVARLLQGTLDHVDPCLPDLFAAPGATLPASPELTPTRTVPLLIAAATSTVLCEVGRLDEARTLFELLMTGGIDDLPHDYSSLAIPAHASIACARLGDVRSAARLHAMLVPHSHRFVNTGASWAGATTHYLGILAATLGRNDEAAARFAAAQRAYEWLGAPAWLSRLHTDRAAIGDVAAT